VLGLVVAGAVSSPGALFAVQHEVSILLDLDDNPTTGCTVPTVDGPFDGVEQVLITTVETSSPPPAGMVTDVAIADCVTPATDTFGPPASFDGGWPIGIDNGEGGLDVVETYFPLLSAVFGNSELIRLAVVVTDELGGEQALLTVDDTPSGAPILLELNALLEIPTLGEWGLILLALLLAAASLALLGRRGTAALGLVLVVLAAGAAWAAGTLDGLIDDWSAGDQLASDGIVLFGKKVDDTLCFRVDVELLFNTSPTADPQAVSTPEDTSVGITLTGSDPESDPLSFTIVPGSGPDHGTLTGAPPNVTYDPDPDYTGPDSFDFQVEDPSGATGTATVSITVDPVNDPPVVDAATFSVAEDAAVGASVGTATFTDPDTGQSHTFAITAGNTGGAFAIGASSGEITVAAALDFETLAAYSLTVEVTDDGAPALSGSNTVDITVTDVDDPPVAVDDAATVTEDDLATAIDVLTNDTDQDGGPKAIASASDPVNGTVVLTGGSPGAHTGLTYQPDPDYCNDPPGTTPDTFTYTLTPGGETATVSVTVTCVNDDPVAVDDTATVAEDSGATTIDVQANDTDADGDTNTITAVQNPSAQGGTVLITNAGADLSYQPAADYCNDPPGTTLDTFTYTLSPGGSTATVTVTVTCEDDPPVAVNDAATVAEDSGANAIDVLANDTDIDGGPKTVNAVQNPSANGGTVLVTGGGTGVSYAPAANYCNAPPGTTPDTFTYTLNGGSMATVSVTVTCADDPPLAVNDSATVAEDSGANAIDVLANDTDIDGGTKLVNVVQNPSTAGGTVLITGGGTGVSYAPAPDYCNDPPGTTLDTFTYTLNGGSMATVTVTVTCLNDGPVLDLDADDDKGTGGANFAVAYTEGAGAELLEDPDDPLGATITDIDSTTLVSLTVTLTNLLDAGEELLDADVSAFAPDITKDYDTTTPGVGVLTISSVTPQPIAAYVAILRTVTYEHTGDDPDATARVVQFVANDGTNDSNTATSTVTLTPVDDDPVAVDDAATVAEDSGATTIDVLANDTDVDAGTISVQSVTQPTNGTVVITNAGADLTYEPDADYCNDGSPTDDFTYTLNGGSTATVAVTVTCADDPPVAVNDAATVAEDSGATTVDVLANDTDVDGGPKTIQSVTQPTNGTVVITNAGADLTYEPDADYCNDGTPTDDFTYTLNGGSSTTVAVTVTCVDDDPVAVADAATVNEDSGANAIDVLANDTDIDGGPKSIQSVTQPTNGTVVITNGGADLTYEPDANYCNDGSPTDDFTYTLNGGSSTTVAVTVTCVDDPPVAVADAAMVNEDSGANAVNVLANDTDIDGGPKTVQSVTQPTNGTVVITGGGTGLTYEPDLNYCNDGTPTDDFTYTLNGGSSTTVSMTVICINDPPVAGADTFDFIGNTELRVDTGASATPHALETTGSGLGLLDNDADPVENDPISIVAIAGCADGTAPFDCTIAGVGTIHVEANGNLSFVPAPGDTDASESFMYTLSDGTDTVNGTVTLNRSLRVWYVDNDTGTAGVDGTSVDPFDTLAEAQSASSANDYVFVHFGDGTTTGQNAGITLKSGQHLLGEHVGLSLPVNLNGNGSPTVLFAAVPGNRPVLGDATAGGPEGVSAIDAIPAEVAGLSLSGNVNAIEWTTNAAFAGTGAFDVHDNVVTGAAAIGVDVNLAGTGATRLSFHDNSLTATGTALNVQETGSGALTITAFDDNSVNGNTGGSGLVVNNAIFDAAPGGGFDLVSGGTTVIGASGNGVGGSGVVLTGVTGDLLFTDLDVFADNGMGLRVTSTGASNLAGGTGLRFRVGAGVGIVEATGGSAVSLQNLTADLQLTTVKSTNTTGTGVDLDTVTDGGGTDAVFSAGSGSAITTTAGATGPAFRVNGGNGKVTYAGTILNNATAGRAVSITSWSGDDATDDLVLSGAIDENGAGILVSGNGGVRAITFSGGLDVDTTSGKGFSATSNTNTLGLNVTGSTNDIDSVSATALEVTSTPIGASDLNFRHVSSGNNTAAAEPANGIVLDNTGASGELIVTGNGGSCTSAATCTGGAIQNTTGHGISLTNTRAPSLTRMFVGGSGGHGIQAANLANGLTLASSYVQNSGNADNEYGLNVSNVAGTVAVSGTTFDNAADDLVHYVNLNTNGSLTVNGASSFVYPGAVGGTANAAIALQPNGTSTLTATIQNNTFTNIVSDSIQWGAATAGSSGTSTLDFSSNTITVNTAGRASGFALSCQESTTGNVTIANNGFSGAGGNGVISVDCNDSSLLSGTISGNVITSPPGIGMFVAVDEAAEARLTITGNTVTNSGGDGIQVVNFGGVGVSDLYLAITGNQVNGHSLNTSVNFVGGISVTSFEDNACIELTGNSVTGTPAGATQCGGAPCVDYYVEEVGGAMQFEEVPNTAATTLSAAYVNSTNDAGPVTVFGIIDLTNGAQCPFP
jgi:VCBS repeat-containing protein